MARVAFSPSGLVGEIDDDTTVLDAARRLGVDLDSVCGGRQLCQRCEVEIDGERVLACTNRVDDDLTVHVPATSQVHRPVVRKDLDIEVFELDPRFTLHYVERSDSLTAALADQHGLEGATVAPWVGPIDADTATIAVESTSDGPLVVAAWPGYEGAAYGLAIDIGSTTVAGHLCDLTTGEVLASIGLMNPQIRFGDDLMSRISYVMMNPGSEAELTAAIRGALAELVTELLDSTGSAANRVLDVVLVANPVMHHIALGYDPVPLGMAPFTLHTDQPVRGRAGELDLDLPNACFYMGPCIAGHVGADTAAAILAEGPHRHDHVQVLVDVGTNAEIVLGSRQRQFAASSPTGPAFEGAQITGGQRATSGAIERVRIDRTSLEPRFRVIGSELWSDEPGFVESLPTVGVTGICGSGIIEVVAEMYLAGVIDTDGTILGANAERTHRVIARDRTYFYVLHDDPDSPLVITQNDVRAIQLAKAALRAGIDLLVEHAGGPDITDIRLAGAFGTHINPVHALVLGLVPDCPVEGVRSVGNAAGVGAVQALLSAAARQEMEEAVNGVVKIETATEPRFQELFVAAMAFPHAEAPSPHLATVVDLPHRPSPEASQPRRRRRSRG
ncbi:MAG: DUF4445 domain-containing protein [Actinomycetia bacterium]|nr:DUF4445 domain-containing protein [Actinomycetes bacterium]